MNPDHHPTQILPAREENNFDLIRLIAASLVIFSHSFILSSGKFDGEPLYALTKGNCDFGALAVNIFFIVSGFLITQSYESSKSIPNYFWKRVLRIFPALIVLLFLSVFVLGPLASTLTPREYFSTTHTYTYLTNVRLLRLQYDLPGVFASNPYPNAINGSLWTLAYEFICYIFVALFGFAGLLKRRGLMLIVFVLTLLPLPIQHLHPNIQTFIHLFAYFAAGMLAYLYLPSLKFKKGIGILSAIIVIAASFTPYFNLVFAIVGSYLMVNLAFAKAPSLRRITKNGDFSYGLYIYAFPIQQLVVQMFGGNPGWQELFLISYVLTLICAITSWNIVEKPALRLKKMNFFSAEKKTT